MANYDHFISEWCRMHLRGGSMGIRGKEGQISGIDDCVRLQQHLITKGGSAQGACVIMMPGTVNL